jgi:hypothetical protein
VSESSVLVSCLHVLIYTQSLNVISQSHSLAIVIYIYRGRSIPHPPPPPSPPPSLPLSLSLSLSLGQVIAAGMQVTLARSVDDYVEIALLALWKRGAVARRWRRELVLRRHLSPLFDRCVGVGVVLWVWACGCRRRAQRCLRSQSFCACVFCLRSQSLLCVRVLPANFCLSLYTMPPSYIPLLPDTTSYFESLFALSLFAFSRHRPVFAGQRRWSEM